MNKDELKRRGEQASALMASGIMAEAFDKLENDYIEEWKNADTHEARERFHLAVTILNRVRQHLKLTASKGEMAKREIAQIGHTRKLRIL